MIWSEHVSRRMERESQSPLLIFDFVDQQGCSQRRVFSQPVNVFSVHSISEVCSTLKNIQTLVDQGYYAAGYISYEAASAFDSAYKVGSQHQMPLLWFGIFNEPMTDADVAFDNEYTMSPWESDTTFEHYSDSIEEIKQAIARGDTYQVNYTMRLRSHFEGDDIGFYHRLKRAQETDYSAYLHMGRYRILSISPELLFEKNGNIITTRPMKGTVQRGRWLEEDQGLASWLASSEKNRAENVMIVDLLRNDLSKIEGVSTVEVPLLFEVEQYKTVYQMTSTVTATMEESTTVIDVLKALFPSASITGAPKISTMGIIAQLEQHPRGIYCGTVGIMEPNGHAMFNVAIRTCVIDAQTGLAEYGVGGGVTWDSTTDGEYVEALTKAELLGKTDTPFDFLETLLLDHGEYTLFERHMARLATTAQFFNIGLDLELVVDRLKEHARHYPAMKRKVRLLVSQSGEVRVESGVLHELTGFAQKVAVARNPILKNNLFLYHKTTRREMYQYDQHEYPGVFDVVLWNEDSEVTECTNGNIVVELDGRMLTPARSCGLLAGTFRAQLLDEGILEEIVLHRSDLERVTKMWMINSVRGWVPIELIDESIFF